MSGFTSSDLTPAASELLYLENARKISLYGMELHEVLVGSMCS